MAYTVDLKDRTKKFALEIIHLVESLPYSPSNKVIGNQILRSGTSIGANYRSACRGRSRPEFIAKLGVAIEEADETIYWLELLIDTNPARQEVLTPLITEAQELVSILTASSKTAQANLTQSRS